jgi:hypothetical protein
MAVDARNGALDCHHTEGRITVLVYVLLMVACFVVAWVCPFVGR